MKAIGAFLLVAAISVFQMLAAPPVGQMLDLPEWAIFLATLTGSISGTLAFLYASERFMPYLTALLRRVRRTAEQEAQKEQEESAEKSGRVRHIADRYGEMGLGLVAPMTIGGFAAALMGTAMGLNRNKLAAWLVVGITIFVLLYSLLIDVTVAKT
jgi:uncharacterized membrane protein